MARARTPIAVPTPVRLGDGYDLAADCERRPGREYRATTIVVGDRYRALVLANLVDLAAAFARAAVAIVTAPERVERGAIVGGVESAAFDSPVEVVAPSYVPPGYVPTFAETWRLAQRIAKTEFVPGSLRDRPDAVLACVLFGRELGIGPMQSLSQINVIDGKPTMSPELMRGLVRGAGHRLTIDEWDDTTCSVTGTRADTGESLSLAWNLERARDAGLCTIVDGRARARSLRDKPLPWESYTRAMLHARATSELCRALFADVIAGVSYTPEELSFAEVANEPEPGPGAVHPALPVSGPADLVNNSVDTVEIVGDEPEVEVPDAASGPWVMTPERIQNLVIRGREVGVDTPEERHAFVLVASRGRTSDVRDLTYDEYRAYLAELNDREPM